jgi:acetolactate synthase-1/3 small subunit
MKRMADIFRGRIIDVTDKTYTIELTGDKRSSSTPSSRRSIRTAILERDP